jgi:hypothetical protein
MISNGWWPQKLRIDRWQLTRVYDVPGKKITIVAKATTGSDSVQVFLYGNKLKNE